MVPVADKNYRLGFGLWGFGVSSLGGAESGLVPFTAFSSAALRFGGDLHLIAGLVIPGDSKRLS